VQDENEAVADSKETSRDALLAKILPAEGLAQEARGVVVAPILSFTGASRSGDEG
jgi:hypothetical protein